MMMRFPRLCLCVMLAAVASLHAQPAAATIEWDTVTIESMKTSIYVGSVTLTTSEFKRAGEQYTATYEARVWPWAFWNETGRITIQLPAADVARLKRGERIEFTGDAANHKGKPRHVTGRADHTGEGTGKIKVRIGVDDTELIFNGTYRVPPSAR
jgi:hypothetical protein